jgi:hypothetical protein
MANAIPSEHYISLLSPTVNQNMIAITDNQGRMISTDRTHLTKYGAIYFGQKAVQNSSYSEIFK